MNHHSHLLLTCVALFLFCWIPLSYAQSQSHIYISEFPFHESFQMSLSDTRFYRLSLSMAPRDLDLTISVTPEQGSDSPKLFVSKNKEFPQTMNDADYSSITTSKNVVFISPQDLKVIDYYLFIGLICESPTCNANILVKWDREMKAIAIGEMIIESLNGVSSALMNLTIPNEDEIERIVIHVDAIKTSKTDELPSLEVAFMNQEKSPINIPRRSSWFEGNTIIIDKDSSLFCTDCTFPLSLRFTDPSLINIQAQIYKKNTLFSGQPILDGVRKGKENSYRFVGRRKDCKEEDFVVSVRVHTGKVKVSIGFNAYYQSSASYNWQYQVENSQDIILSHKWRCDYPTENYFILVEGEESSVYSLSAAYKKPNQLLVGKATPVHNEIFPQEKITYVILMPLFIAEEITLNLRSDQSLEVNITNCRFATDCPGILPADSQHKITDYYGFDDKMTEYDSEEIAPYELRITINPHKSGCYPILIQDQAFTKERVSACAYLVTIENQQLSPVDYTLTTEYKGPNLLTISEPKFDIIAKKSSLYYVFSVSPHVENIESIQIQLTKFSGDVDIFVSRTNKNPNKESHEDIPTLSYEGLLIIKDRPDLSGIYYIGVHGRETSSISLSVTIQTKPTLPQDSALLLNPGKPQKGILLPKHQYQAGFYKILLNQDRGWDGILHITVKSLSGRVLIVANNNGELPTGENHQWEGKDHDLKIPVERFCFKEDGLYYVGIFMDMTDPDAHLLTDLTYYITYSLITSPEIDCDENEDVPPKEYPFHMFLSQNTPFYDVIEKGELHYFEALIPVDQFPITIHKHSASENVQLYISTNLKNKYPDQYSHTKKTTKDSISFKACHAMTATLGCSVYITAILTGKWDKTSLSLAISSQESSAIVLEDGRRVQSIIPMDNLPARFYYHAIPSKPFVVIVSSSGREAVVYAKRIKVDIESQEKPEIEILNEKTAEFTGATEISVPPLVGSDFTIVAVSVYFKETKGSESTFKIEASSLITQLPLVTSYSGFVEKDRYVYFMTNVSKSECILLVSLKNGNIYGETDLVISYGENGRPTISNHQFAMISNETTKIIETNHPSIFPMSGSWVIGVYGREAGDFTLTAVSEGQKMIDLKPGIPVEMMPLKESSFVYFKFDHTVRQSFQINLTKFSGQFNLYMTSIESYDRDFVPHFPNKTHHKWQILRVPSQSVMTVNFHGCIFCVYLMKIEAISSGKFSLEINHLLSSVPMEARIHYKGQLKPQESSVFLVKKTNSPEDENQLDIEMKGKELSVMGSHDSSINRGNYLWKESLTESDPSRKISLSSLDSVYLLLENPKDQSVEYSMVPRQFFQTFFGESAERVYDLDPLGKNYFGFNSTDSKGFSADVIFYAARSDVQNLEAIMKNDLKKGQKLKAKYWAAAGEEREVYLEAATAPKIRSNSSHIIFEQNFCILNSKGKYLVEIFNPWKFKTKFRIFMRKSGIRKLDILSHFLNDNTIKYDEPKFYEIPQKTPGNWYFWLNSCGVALDLKIENGDLETGMVTIPKGNSYLYKEVIQAGPRDVWMNVNPKFPSDQGRFVLHSAVFNETDFKNFDLKEENLGVDVTYKNQGENKTNMTVEFKPVELEDPESYDEVDYQIWLCPDLPELCGESPLCNEIIFHKRCRDESLKLAKDQKESVKVNFQDVNYGAYFVEIKATIKSKDQSIKDVQPYATANVKVERPIFGKISKIQMFIGIIIIIVLIAAVFFYKKLKVRQDNKGVELQESRKDYKPLEESENDERSSESQEIEMKT